MNRKTNEKETKEAIAETSAGVWGLCGLVVASLAIFVSMAGYPGFLPTEHYISRLGTVRSPLRCVFNIGLVLSAFLFLPFLSRFHLMAENRWGRLAAVSATLAGLFLAMVGLFPGDLELIHGFAAVLFFVSISTATLAMGMGLHVRNLSKRADPIERSLARAFFLTFGLQALCLLSGVVYAAFRLSGVKSLPAHMLPSDLMDALIIHPGIFGRPLNPAALLEWTFVAGSGLLLGALCVHLLWKHRVISEKSRLSKAT